MAAPRAVPAKPPTAEYAVAIAACCASCVQGYNQGVYNGALLFIRVELFPDDAAMEGLVTSMLLYGTVVGVLLSLSFLGRRRALMVASALLVVCGALFWWCPNTTVLLIARFVAGFAAGINTVNVPLFLAECARPAVRGHVVSLAYTMLIVGILTSYAVNLVLSLTGSSDWRLMLGIVAIPAAVVLVVLQFLPESPRFLVLKGRIDEARAVLLRLRGDDQVAAVEEELASIIKATTKKDASAAINDSDDSDDQQPLLLPPPATSMPLDDEPDMALDWKQAGHTLLYDPTTRRALVVCVTLEFFQQFTGSQAVSFYTPTILQDSGIETIFASLGLSDASAALMASLIVYVIQLPFMVTGSHFIDAVGRRNMLLGTTPFLVMALVLLGVSYELSDTSAAGAWLAFGGLLLFKCTYSPGLGPIPQVIESEIFAPPVRSSGLTVAATFGSAFNIIILQAFPVMQQAMGDAVPFYIFAGLSVMAELFIFLCIPETTMTVLEDAFRVFKRD